jgi:hypothetical protein
MQRNSFLPACLIAFALLVPGAARASSHSEAPGTAKDRLADDTDLYAFVASDARDAVTIVGDWVPLLEPNSGPNFFGFDDDAYYYMNIDNVGDAQRHIRYQFKFKTTRSNPNTFLYNTGVVTSLDDPDLNVRQTYTLTRYDNGAPTVLVADAPVAPNFVGPASMPNYERLAQSAITKLADGTTIFVGPRDDPFFVDLGAVFDLLTIRKVPGNKGRGVDGVSGYNVLSVVIQIPKTRLTKDGAAPKTDANNHIIGVWDTVERLATRTINADGTVSTSGDARQVSRLGMPLVNEVVIPLGSKDKFNASEPINDVANFGAFVVDPELARLFNAIYGVKVPAAPRNDLVTVFATGVPGLNQPAGVAPAEMLRLNMTIPPAAKPNRFGVIAGDLAGFPNGRRLADDVVDIEERVVAGVLVDGFNIAPNNQLGDGIDANDKPFLPYFPYVAPPHDPFDPRGHNVQHGKLPHGRGAPYDSDTDVEDEVSEGTGAVAGPAPALALASAQPASAVSILQYSVPERARVKLALYDVQGRTVRTLVDQDAAPERFGPRGMADPTMARHSAACTSRASRSTDASRERRRSF